MATSTTNASPQIGVRFKPADMQRLKDRAEADFAGNVSTLVKVAVKRLLDGETPSESTAESDPAELAAAS